MHLLPARDLGLWTGLLAPLASPPDGFPPDVRLAPGQADELEEVDVEGTRAWVTAGDAVAPSDPPRGVRLLPYFDGYSYRVGILSPELLYPGPAATRVLPGAFQNLIIDGVVAGLWHQRRSGRRIDITVEPVIPLTAAQRTGVKEQAERVGAILEGQARLTFGTVTTGAHA